MLTPNPQVVEIDLGGGKFSDLAEGRYQYALDDMLEVAFERDFIWDGGFGQLGLVITLNQAGQNLESWPETNPIQLEVPEKNKELFWPT
jgi:hypothetical protein